MRPLAALAIATAVCLGPSAPTYAQAPAAPALEGSWIVEVTVAPTIPVGQFIALETYSRGGGLVTTNNIDRSQGLDVGQGAWQRKGPDAYHISIVFFVFNPDGTRRGTMEVSHDVRLDGRDAYAGEGVATLRSTAGIVLASAPFTTTARRLAATAF